MQNYHLVMQDFLIQGPLKLSLGSFSEQTRSCFKTIVELPVGDAVFLSRTSTNAATSHIMLIPDEAAHDSEIMSPTITG
jgi:hypothetical protein